MTLAEYIRQADLPARHLAVKPADTEQGQQWRQRATELYHRLGQGVILCLHGSRGGGKTQMAVTWCKAVCAREAKRGNYGHGFPALYCRAMEVYMAIKATYGREGAETESTVVQRFCLPQLLVIDEAHERPDTQWATSLLTLIIDQRYAMGDRDTVIIANAATAEEMAALAGPSIASRVLETGGMVDCSGWGSFRG